MASTDVVLAHELLFFVRYTIGVPANDVSDAAVYELHNALGLGGDGNVEMDVLQTFLEQAKLPLEMTAPARPPTPSSGLRVGPGGPSPLKLHRLAIALGPAPQDEVHNVLI